MRIVIAALLLFLCSSLNLNAQICLGATSFTTDPPPVGGEYTPNTTVDVCFTVTGYNQTAVNWLHGVVPDWGPGWDVSSAIPTAPGSCDGDGNWLWMDSGGVGPGFYYDSSLGGPLDGNPFNNYGDADVGDNCAVTFCWQITTISSCSGLVDLTLTINTTGDWETGSWGSVGCQTDPDPTEPLSMVCCDVAPPATGLTGPTAFCTGAGGTQTYTVNSDPLFTSYEWTLPPGAVIVADNGNSVDVDLSAATSGQLCVSGVNDCAPGDPDCLDIVFDDAGGFSVDPAPLLCGGQSLDLNSLVSITTGTVTFYDADPAFGIGNVVDIVNPSISTSYWAEYIDAANGCTAVIEIPVSVSDAAVFTILPLPPICPGAEVDLNTLNGPELGSFEWFDDIPSIGLPAGLVPANGLSYWVLFTDGVTGCTDSLSLSVTGAGTIDFDPPVGLDVCGGSEVVLSDYNGASAGTYDWYADFPAYGNLITDATVSSDTSFWVIYTDPLTFCYDSVAVDFLLSPPPIFSVQDTPPVCEGQSFALTDLNGFDGGTYQWFEGLPSLGIAVDMVNPLEGIEYWVVYTDPITACTDSTFVGFTVGAGTDFSVAEIPPLCEGQTITLSDYNGPDLGFYTWFEGLPTGGLIVEELTLAPDQEIWVLFYEDGSTCFDSLQVSFELSGAPEFSVQEIPPVCAGAELTFADYAGPEDGTFTWYDGLPSIGNEVETVSPTEPTPYWVLFNAAGGPCVDSLEVTVDITATPPFTILEQPPACEGQVFDLNQMNGPEDGSFDWFDGFPSGGNAVDEIEADNNDLYWVLFTDAMSGCTDSLQILFAADGAPDFEVLTPEAICAGDELDLEGLNGPQEGSFEWFEGIPSEGVSVGLVSPEMDSSYWVLYSTDSGCVDSLEVNVSVLPLPLSSFESDPTVCADGSSLISVNFNGTVVDEATANFVWDFGGGDASPGTGVGPHQVSFADAGTVEISLSVSEGGCNSEPFVANVEAIDPVGVPEILCSSTPNSVSFEWSAIPDVDSYSLTILVNGESSTLDNYTELSYEELGLSQGDVVEIVVTTNPTGDNPCGPTENSLECSADDCPTLEIELDLPTEVCATDAAFSVDALSPADVQVSGQAVFEGEFDPASVDPGSYEFSYFYVAPDGCEYSNSGTVEILPQPTADFEVDSDDICIDGPVTVSYTGNAGTSAEYNWDFGGGTETALGGESYEVSYAGAGSGEISLSVTQNGCTSEPVTQTITLSEPVEAPTINCSSTTTTVYFEWSSVEGAESYDISIGIGGETPTPITDIDDALTSYEIDNLPPDETTEVVIEVQALGPLPCGPSDIATAACSTSDCPPNPIVIDIEDLYCQSDGQIDFEAAGLVGPVGVVLSGEGINNNAIDLGALDPASSPILITATYTDADTGCEYESNHSLSIDPELDPVTVVCMESSDETVTIEWNPVNGADDYSIDYEGLSETTSNTNFTANNLPPGSTITFIVTAQTNSLCGPTEGSVDCTTSSCPIVDGPIAEQVVLCVGDDIDLSTYESGVSYTDDAGTFDSFAWYLDDALTQPLTAVGYLGDNCEVQNVTAYLGLICTISDIPPIPAGTVQISLYPDFDLALTSAVPGDCAPPALTTSCDNYVITPSDTAPVTVEPGEGGEVIFTIQFLDENGIGCFETELPVPYSCAPLGCPTVTSPSDVISNLCESEIVDLSTVEAAVQIEDLENTAGGLLWYADALFTQPLDLSTLIYTGDGCNSTTVTAYLGLACTVDPAIVYAGSIVVNFYPEFDESFLLPVPGDCEGPSLTATCANYQIDILDQPIDVFPGESGEGTFSVSYISASGISCFSEEIPVPYSCAPLGCPTVTPADTMLDVCAGEAIDFASAEAAVIIADPELTSAGLSWYSDAGLGTVLDPGSLSYQGDGCEISTTTVYLGLACTVDPVIVYAGSLTINFYPTFDVNLLVQTPGECAAPILTSSCANYQINPIDVPTEVPAGESGEGTFSISYNAPSGLSCFTEEIPVPYSCAPPGCPMAIASETSQSLCSNEIVDLAATEAEVIIDDPEGTSTGLSWYTDTGLSIPLDPANLVYQGDGCSNFQTTIYLGLGCDQEATAIYAGSLQLTFFPDYDNTLVSTSPGDCAPPSIQINCPDYELTEVDVPTIVEAGDTGAATWSITYGQGADCWTETVTENFNCASPVCPTTSSPLQVVENICDGDLLDLVTLADSVPIDNAAMAGELSWFTDVDMITAFTGDLIPYSGDACQAYTQTLYLGLVCTVDQSMVSLGTVQVNVYPEITSTSEYIQTTEGECAPPTVTLSCDNFSLNPVAVPASVAPGEGGVGIWTVNFIGAEFCGETTIEVPYACAPQGCPVIDQNASGSFDLCAAELPDLQAVVAAIVITDFAENAGPFSWYSDAALSTVADPGTYTYSGDNCNTDTYTLYLGLECTIDPNPVFAGSVDLVFYPDYDESLLLSQTGECAPPVLQSNCGQYVLTELDVPTTVESGDSGQAQWQVTYATDFNCFDAQIVEVDYACSDCATIEEPLAASLNICNGDVQDLSQYESNVLIDDPAGTFVSWHWFSDAALTAPVEPSDFDYTGDQCEAANVTLYIAMECNLITDLIPAGSLSLTIFPDVDLTQLSSVEGDCALPQLTSNCTAYALTELDLPDTVEAGEAGVGIWTVSSLLPDGTTCSTEEVQVAYACPLEGCPIVQNTITQTFDLCISDAVDLSTALNQLDILDVDGNLGAINWYDSAALDNAIDPSTLAYSGDNCQIQSVEIFCGIECLIDPNLLIGGSVLVNFYPDYNADFMQAVTGDCSPPMLTTSCASYLITEIDVPTEVNPGDTGTATYNISFNENAASNPCFPDQDFEVQYNCGEILCFTVTEPVDVQLDLCQTDQADYDSALAALQIDDPEGTFVSSNWYNDAALTELADLNSISYSGDGCEVQSFQLFVGASCSEQAELVAGGVLNINIYPDFDASLLTTTDTACEQPEIALLCDTYQASLTSPAPDPIEEGMSGEVSWEIIANGGCWTEIVTASYDCPIVPCTPPDDPIGADFSYCEGTPPGLLTIVDNLVDNYIWYAEETATTVLATGNSYQPDGPGVVWVQAMSPDSCLSVNLTPIILTELAQLDAGFSYPSQTYCSDEPIANPTSNMPGGTYTADALILDPITGAFDPTIQSAGNHTVTYTIDGDCPDSQTFNIEIIAQPSATLDYPELICLGDDWQVEAIGNTNGIATWIFPQGSPSSATGNGPIAVIWPEAGTFDFTLSIEDAGCTYTTNGSLQVDQLSIAATGSQTIFPGQPAELSITGNAEFGNDITYSWSPTEGLDCNDCNIVQANPLESTEYVVLAINENGCADTETLLVVVDDEVSLMIPNAFSPNNDGTNDQWGLITKNATEAQFWIYDRWGQLMFTGQSLEDSWDGTHDGEPVQIGVYVYYCEVSFLNGENNRYKGNVTVVR